MLICKHMRLIKRGRRLLFLLQIRVRVQGLARTLLPGMKKRFRGLTPAQAMLAIFFTAISGLKNLSKVGSIQDPGIAIAAGL